MARARVTDRTPPGAGLLGRDVTVTTADGRRLRAMVAGDGDDLVVLEAGLGGSGLTWGPVHGILARTHRVVAYDRAGLGGSDPDPAPRDLDRLADDLEAVVAAFPHRRLVLVGHSWGGPVVRVAAARRIARGLPTAGVVLVDPSDERAR
ncbi:alpha/beta fold hydrolase, partial [Clavibacter lycopersici]